MQQPVKDRIGKLREEIAQISDENRLYAQGGKRMPGAPADQQRRIQRLEEILDELKSLTDWKKLCRRRWGMRDLRVFGSLTLGVPRRWFGCDDDCGYAAAVAFPITFM
jgi:hypothetical protein